MWGAVLLVALFVFCVGIMGYQAYWHLTDPVGFDAHYRCVWVNSHCYRAAECLWKDGHCLPKF